MQKSALITASQMWILTAFSLSYMGVNLTYLDLEVLFGQNKRLEDMTAHLKAQSIDRKYNLQINCYWE